MERRENQEGQSEQEQNAILRRLCRKHDIGVFDSAPASQGWFVSDRVLAFGRELLQAVQERERWISVEERLPKYYENVLGAFPQSNGAWCIAVTYLCDDGEWLGQPTYWRPLPNPPGEAQTYADLFQESTEAEDPELTALARCTRAIGKVG